MKSGRHFKIRRHKNIRGDVLSLLFISIYILIVHPVVEENVVYVAIVDPLEPVP